MVCMWCFVGASLLSTLHLFSRILSKPMGSPGMPARLDYVFSISEKELVKVKKATV